MYQPWRCFRLTWCRCVLCLSVGFITCILTCDVGPGIRKMAID
ncbi:hypothetical protein CGRA01v4_12738 [Colletotrichum graminicola]|nr:hypothetical protein CGRA01v4_12738 [Colletotrichum graminicola]